MLQILIGYLNTVNAAVSTDGKILVSALDDETVRLWDAGLGTVLQTFEVDSVIQNIFVLY